MRPMLLPRCSHPIHRPASCDDRRVSALSPDRTPIGSSLRKNSAANGVALALRKAPTLPNRFLIPGEMLQLSPAIGTTG